MFAVSGEGIAVTFPFDLFERFSRGIRREEGSDQKAENHKTDHNRGGAGKVSPFVDSGEDDVPDPQNEPRGKKGDPLSEGTVACRIQLTVPKLVERLLA